MGISDKLFANPGGQLKKLAIRVFWSIFICCSLTYLIAAICMIVAAKIPYPLILTPIAIMIFYGIAWLVSISTYAFGELVENSSYLKPKNSKINNSTSTNQNNTNKNSNNKHTQNNISKLYDNVDLIDISCPHCNEILTYDKQELKDTKKLQCPWCYKEFDTNIDI